MTQKKGGLIWNDKRLNINWPEKNLLFLKKIKILNHFKKL